MKVSPWVYDSAFRGIPPLEELREVVRYRDLIFQLARRDVTTRYKRSVLGIAWTMLNPLGMMVVLTIAFSHIFRFQTEHSYPAYVLSGLLAWNFFSQTLLHPWSTWFGAGAYCIAFISRVLRLRWLQL